MYIHFHYFEEGKLS